MISSLLVRLTSVVEARFGFNPFVEKTLILNKELTIRRNSYRLEVDYDDAWLLACAIHSETVFDIGANMGQTAIVMLLGSAIKRIVLIDPNPNALAIAAENLIRNQLSANASFVCAFAGEKADETVKFWTFGVAAAGSMYAQHSQTIAKRNNFIEVISTTLDNICEHFSFTPDLVKIDVEGAESKVLAGAKKCAGEKKTRFLVEMHSNRELSMNDNADAIINWCDTVNYKPWYLKNHIELTAPDIIQHRGRCHLLLQPKEWEYPTWLKNIEQLAPIEKAMQS